MKSKNQINLLTAILINVNIILGAGLFINPKPLTQFAGPFGFVSYILAAIIILPIVLIIAKLATKSQEPGGLYVYSKNYINPTVGFISAWSYFLGKTSSAALLAHIFVSFFQRNIIFLQSIPTIILDILLIFFLVFINIIGVKIGSKIQYFFTLFKLVPFLFVLIVGFYFFEPNFFATPITAYPDFFSALPISIFVFLSFEMICSIGHLIKDPEKNIRRAIIFSFVIVASAATLFQLAIFGSLGSVLKTFTEPVASLASLNFPNYSILPILLNTFVFGSIISGSFGSLTANCWNLYAISKDRHLPINKLLTKVNKNNIPWVALIIEGLIACLLLAITKNQVPLQNMTVFGIGIAYLCSSFAAFKISKNRMISQVLPLLAILGSFYIIWLCSNNLFTYGISLPFLIIFLTGILLKIWQKVRP